MKNLIKKYRNKTYNFLRWTERWTKTDMVYFASGNFWLIGGRVLSIAIGMLLTIAFANLLPPESFGTYKYILSLAGILTAFSLAGMGTAVIKTVAQGYDGIMKYSNWISLKWGLLGSFLSLITATYYFIQGNNIIGASLIILALTAPISKVGGLSSAFLHGKKDFKRLTTYGVPRTIVSTLIMIIVVFLTDNVIIIIASYFISSALLSVLTYYYVIKAHKPNSEHTNKEAEEEMLKYAKHLSIMGVFTRLASELDKLLLWHYAGPVQLAIYTFASAPVRELRNLTENFFPLALPKFAKKDFSEVKKHLPFRIFQMTMVILPIVIGYILFAPLLFKILFPQYIESVIYTQLFALSLLMQPSGFISTALTAHAKIKEKYTVTTTSSVVRLILFAILIPLYGILGIIFSILISELLTYMTLFYLLKKA